jgi:hypothetical protein
MMADLDLLKRNLKDFIFKEGKRSMKLFDPNVDLRGLEEAVIWGSNPVHLRPEIYGRIAEGVVKMTGMLDDKTSSKRKRTNSLEDDQQQRPPRGGGRGGNSVTRGRLTDRGGSRRGYRGQPRVRGYTGYNRGHGYY